MGRIATVNLPDIGEGVVEGEVIEWLKKVGDDLRQDEPVVVVMTDKATVELPSPYPGKLAKQYFQPGQIAIRDKPLYDIEVEGEIHLPSHTKPSLGASLAPKPIPSASPKKTLATPPTRKRAKELGIDINTVQGTGKDGRVTLQDLEMGSTRDVEIQPLIGIRSLMAQRMAESKRTIPHFSYFEQAEATRLIILRNKFKEQGLKEHVNITFMPFLIKALSLTIQQFPILNSSLEEQQILLHKRHNIGIATTTSHGLIVPVLKDVQKYALPDLIRQYEDLKQRAAENKLFSSDMKEATITISNFGVLGGGLWATPIINPPEAAILAMAKIQKQPIVKNDEIVARDLLNLSWSFDHRLIDGDQASQISHYYCALIQNPASLL